MPASEKDAAYSHRMICIIPGICRKILLLILIFLEADRILDIIFLDYL